MVFMISSRVHDKFVGAPIVGSMKKGIWVPKSLTLEDPSKFGYVKGINLFLYVNYKAEGRQWVLDSGCTQHMTRD